MSDVVEEIEQPSRSMLFVPGSNASWLSTVQVYGADYVMFDLEDSVAVREKDTARLLVREAIKSPIWAGHEVVVRINGIETPFFHDDLEAVVSAGPVVPVGWLVVGLPQANRARAKVATRRMAKSFRIIDI